MSFLWVRGDVDRNNSIPSPPPPSPFSKWDNIVVNIVKSSSDFIVNVKSETPDLLVDLNIRCSLCVYVCVCVCVCVSVCQGEGVLLSLNPLWKPNYLKN